MEKFNAEKETKRVIEFIRYHKTANDVGVCRKSIQMEF